MQPSAQARTQRKPIGRPVVEDSDDDPDFKKGPIEVTEKEKAKPTRGGKKRPVKESNPPAGPVRPHKRRKFASSKPRWDSSRNPLIELLGVQDDDYFKCWDSEEEIEDAGSGELEEDGGEIEDVRIVLYSALKDVVKRQGSENDPSATDTDGSITQDEDGPPIDPKILFNDPYDKDFIKRATRELSKAEQKAEARRRKRQEDPSATDTDSDVPVDGALRAKRHMSDKLELAVDDKEDGSSKPCFEKDFRPPSSGPYVLSYSEGVIVPGSINKYLRPYQREGVKFLWDQYRRSRGGILGDDMGLGKTIQVISFLSAIMGKHANARDIDRRHQNVDRMQDEGYQLRSLTGPEPKYPIPSPNSSWPTCLLVTPVPLLANWKSELDTWGYFEFEVYGTGQKAKQDSIIHDFRLGRLDIVLVSFDMLNRQPEQFCDEDWSVVIVDEVHRIKNPTSKGLNVLSSFKCTRRFGLTGTAIQNNYEELWTLLNWSNPRKVGTVKQWKRSISEPLKRGQSSKATLEEQRRGQIVATNLVHKLLPHFFIRRDKRLLDGQLPKKIDQVAFCPLTEKQKEAYRNFLSTPAIDDILRKDEECECESLERRGKCCHPISAATLLEYINVFIKISNSLSLICNVEGDSNELNQRLQEIAFPGNNRTRALLPTETNQEEYCGKWKVLNGLLKRWQDENNELERIDESEDQQTAAKRNKVLIFTKSRKLLDVIGATLDYEGYKSCRLHGGLKPDERQKNIEDFQDKANIFVFLITTQAGGVGLNLTAANKVIIFDPNWNPAHDLQAMDRAFRIGQTRDVEVYRLLAAGCIEELIYKRQLYKQQMMMIGYEASTQPRYFEGIQGMKDMEGELFGIKNLFQLSETGDTQFKIEKARLDEDLWRRKAMEEGGSSEGVDSGVFDLVADSPEEAKKKKEELNQKKKEIKQTLLSLGVDYSHSNQELLQASMKERARLFPKRETTKRKSGDGVPRYNAPKRPRKRPSGSMVVVSD